MKLTTCPWHPVFGRLIGSCAIALNSCVGFLGHDGKSVSYTAWNSCSVIARRVVPRPQLLRRPNFLHAPSLHPCTPRARARARWCPRDTGGGVQPARSRGVFWGRAFGPNGPIRRAGPIGAIPRVLITDGPSRYGSIDTSLLYPRLGVPSFFTHSSNDRLRL